jgi:hypothetical protein
MGQFNISNNKSNIVFNNCVSKYQYSRSHIVFNNCEFMEQFNIAGNELHIFLNNVEFTGQFNLIEKFFSTTVSSWDSSTMQVMCHISTYCLQQL